jgi:hypothetical protein
LAAGVISRRTGGPADGWTDAAASLECHPERSEGSARLAFANQSSA